MSIYCHRFHYSYFAAVDARSTVSTPAGGYVGTLYQYDGGGHAQQQRARVMMQPPWVPHPRQYKNKQAADQFDHQAFVYLDADADHGRQSHYRRGAVAGYHLSPRAWRSPSQFRQSLSCQLDW